jgi:hypothetical protein
MNAPVRIGLYAGGLAAVFAASMAVAGAVAPEKSVQAWTQSDHTLTAAGTHEDTMEGAVMVSGLSLEQGGYELGVVSAPETVGSAGELSFTVTTADGEPVTDFTEEHTKRLHLIVVRSDGSQFRHVHPEMDADGRWSLPWTWDAAGSYRVYADFVPAGGGSITLTRSVEVAGDFQPVTTTAQVRTSSVDGFDVTLHGELTAGTASPLTVEVTRNGQPVTTLEPYLGAFGHLVALRAGDLAYLHVHPEGDAPAAGQLSGPTVTFVAEAPTAGRYLLYLDFQVDGQVHTATFALDVVPGDPGQAAAGDHAGASHGH